MILTNRINFNQSIKRQRSSPFFYAVLCMIKSEDINVNIMQEDICKLNEDVNELLKQNDIQILEFTDITIVKNIVFDKLGVENES